ncbi:hypothetical protein GCM10010315_54660 [Streptomyces luteosporeus]|uniref:Uncharacterized protein n=1 Tax=Streptomyces luteosporeus TaxID=173856 RepID=A0ABN3U515_9ACTN
MLVTPGQRADCTQFEPVMERIPVPRPAAGRSPFRAAATRYDNRACVDLGTVTAAVLMI